MFPVVDYAKKSLKTIFFFHLCFNTMLIFFFFFDTTTVDGQALSVTTVLGLVFKDLLITP